MSSARFFDRFFTPEAKRPRFVYAQEWLEAYWQDLRAVPLLTPQQEADLLERSACGEQEARQRLVEANLRLVVCIALSFQGHGLPLGELIQEGNLGLLEAVVRFDRTKGRRLSTYAKYWIVKFIQMAIQRQSRPVPLSTRSTVYLQQIKQALSESRAQGIEPGVAQIAQKTHLSVEQVCELLPLVDDPLPLHGNEADRMCERLAAPPLLLVAQTPAQPSLSARLRDALSHLGPTEQRVLALRFGLLDGVVHDDYHEIAWLVFERRGRRVDERVRQLEKQALGKIRCLLEAAEMDA